MRERRRKFVACRRREKKSSKGKKTDFQRTDDELDPLPSLAGPLASASLRHGRGPVRPRHERHLPPGVGRRGGERAEGLGRERPDLGRDCDGARDEERALVVVGGGRRGSGGRDGFSGLFFSRFVFEFIERMMMSLRRKKKRERRGKRRVRARAREKANFWVTAVLCLEKTQRRTKEREAFSRGRRRGSFLRFDRLFLSITRL